MSSIASQGQKQRVEEDKYHTGDLQLASGASVVGSCRSGLGLPGNYHCRGQEVLFFLGTETVGRESGEN